MIQKGFLAQELGYRYTEMRARVLRPDALVERPLFLERGKAASERRIYLCNANQLDSAPPAAAEALLLCLGEPSGAILDAADYCLFPADMDTSVLMNFVQRVFDRFDEWDLRLRHAAGPEGGVTALLDCASDMLQNPVWLADASGRLLARAERFGAERVREECETSYKMMERFRAGDGGSHVPEAQPFRASLEGGSSELLCVRFSAGDAAYALLSAGVERAFYGSDETVLERLGGYMQEMLLERRAPADARRRDPALERSERLLRDALEQKQPERAVQDGLEALSWRTDGRYYVAAAETLSGDRRESRLYAVCERAERELHGCAFLHDAFIALVFPAFTGSEAALTSLAEAEGLRVGLGEAREGVLLLSQRWRQATIALERGKASAEQVCAFAGIAGEYLLDCCLAQLPFEIICLDAVQQMMAYDQAHGTAYLETARRYVANRFNAVRTASELFIHRSTFLYRLERIMTQFGLDLDGAQGPSLRLIASLELAQRCMGDIQRPAKDAP